MIPYCDMIKLAKTANVRDGGIYYNKKTNVIDSAWLFEDQNLIKFVELLEKYYSEKLS